MYAEKIMIYKINNDNPLIVEISEDLFGGKVKSIEIAHEKKIIKIDYEDDHEWDCVEYPFSSLESFIYVQQERKATIYV